MIIDGHAHAFGEFAYSEKLIPLMDNLGVDKVVLCPGGTDPDYEFKIPKIAYRKSSYNYYFHILGNVFFLRLFHKKMNNIDNEYVFSLVKDYPDRLMQYFWTNPNDPELISTLEENFVKMSFAGIKLHQCLNKFSNEDEGMKIISQFAAEKNMPIFIHLYNFKEAKKLVKLAQEFPKANYIIAHSMGLETIAKKGERLKNIYFDISTYFIISEKRIHFAMEKFGEDKVLLGSDSPLGYRNLELNIEKIRKMDLTEKQKNKILGENIAKLLNL